MLWRVVYLMIYRPTPVALHRWRCWLLRRFGAHIESPAYPYPDIQVWAPWHLTMEAGSCLGPGVKCYNVAPVRLGRGATVSQRAYLCTASHDFDRPDFPLIGAEISIGADAWVAAEAFVGPGVRVGLRSVVLARAVVVKDTQAGTVHGGNPAKYLRDRAGAHQPQGGNAE